MFFIFTRMYENLADISNLEGLKLWYLQVFFWAGVGDGNSVYICVYII